MRGRVVFGVVTLAVLVAVGSCKDDVGLTSIPPEPERYIAFLNGANEPTPIATAAQGLATVTVRGDSIDYRIELSNIDSATLAHIHHGAAGVSSGVIQNLYIGPRPPTGLDFSGLLVDSTVAVTAAVLTQIRADTTYVNVHTRVNGGGEIRGQLFRFQ
jgi:CHRD domain-containing protein